ncbi:MAG: macro domain-containing protein, partial [Chroococcales cyanobacterium]
EECRKIGGCATGDAKITQGYNLPAKWVIHTVGPVWRGGNQGETEELASCYRRSLEIAEEHSIESIAFPAISTGIYAFPLEEATKIAVTEVSKFLQTDTPIQQVIFVCFSQKSFDCYSKVVQKVLENNS